MARLNSRSAYYMYVPKIVFDQVCSLIPDEEYNGRVYLTYRGTNMGGEMRLSSSMANADVLTHSKAICASAGTLLMSQLAVRSMLVTGGHIIAEGV